MLRLAQHLDPAANWAEIQLLLVDDDHMRDANQSVFGKDSITDVISLRYRPMPPSEALYGELFLNVDAARRAPTRKGWSPGHELALYLAHGIDHLQGAEDQSPEERRRMRRRELRWLQILARKEFTHQDLLG